MFALKGLVRSDGKMRFTKFLTHAKLRVAAGGDADKAKKLLEKVRGELSGDEFSQERCSSDDRGFIGLESSCVEFSLTSI